MNKKQITVTIIALIAFVAVYGSSQSTAVDSHYNASTQINVPVLIGGWITTVVVWLGLMAILKSKPKV